MAKTKRIKIYKFKELSDEAKQYALQKYAEECQYNWGDESIESLKKFAEHFNCSLSKEYSIDFSEPHRNSVSFIVPTYVNNWSEEELRDTIEAMGSYNKETLKGNGDCKLTGVCFDEDVCDGARIAFYRKGERGIYELLMAGLNTWQEAVRMDCEYQFSEKGYAETCEANDYWFTIEGRMI